MVDRPQRIKELYNAALERPIDERDRFLAEVCAGDDELLRELKSLLNYEAEAASFIEKPALHFMAEALSGNSVEARAQSTTAGHRFGSYTVIEPIGAGGMGEVYLAKDARLGRRVALKLLPLRFTSDPDRVRRFESEARAASSLNHPNIVTVFEIGEDSEGKQRFIATEFIDGLTLRQLLLEGPIKIDRALDIVGQVATALVAAHEAGIIHRDIKPENVMIRRDGIVKVLDFGLAKLTETAIANQTEDISDFATQGRRGAMTGPSVILGTPRYMSPEQARGTAVDARTDIFSLGVVLYEMITGSAPFTGATPSDVIALILTKQPRALREFVAEIPGELESIVERALAKDRDARYITAREMLGEIQKLREEISFAARLKKHSVENLVGRTDTRERPVPRDSSARKLLSILHRLNLRSGRTQVIGGVVFALLVALGWMLVHQRNLRWARSQVPRIQELARSQRHFEAFDLATEALRYLGRDASVDQLMPTIGDSLTVTSEPPGAKVFLRRFGENNESAQRVPIGVTPVNKLLVARGEYVLELEMDGYEPFRRTISSRLQSWGTAMLPPDDPTTVHQRMIEKGKLPSRMVFVPGGKYRMVGRDKPTPGQATLDDYFIDEYEVTNREFKEFIAARGYLDRKYWKHPFVKDGRSLSWDEGIEHFKDRTRLPAPRGWAGQNYPEGKAEHPVTEITWYEAAAYADFRGKTLPTIFQWEKAARNGVFTYYSAIIMPWGPIDVRRTTDNRANFKSDGTRPVGSFEFGMSPFGCYDMAGNVAEWCFNATPDGFVTLGASWDDLSYLFSYVGELPGFHSSAKLGFRCVLTVEGGKGNQGAMKLDVIRQAHKYTSVDEATFRNLTEHYRYDRGPLGAKTIETTETDDWRREKLTYNGARDEQVIAYLYLPKNYSPPFQVIQFVPAGDVYGGYVTLPESLEMVLPPHIKAGRAVFSVVFKGFKEREHAKGYAPTAPSSVRRREELVGMATDLRRGVDYLMTRADIDHDRIAYYGYSQGATEGLIFSALEERFRSVVLVAGGLWGIGRDALPDVTHSNFVPNIRAPKLMINGRYDEVHSMTKTIEPLYKLMREKKKLVLYDGSHSPPIELAVPAINQWLDETMGPVRQ